MSEAFLGVAERITRRIVRCLPGPFGAVERLPTMRPGGGRSFSEHTNVYSYFGREAMTLFVFLPLICRHMHLRIVHTDPPPRVLHGILVVVWRQKNSH